MTIWHTLHLAAVFTWLGLVLAETLMEWLGREEGLWGAVARLHYWIDLCLEIPLVTLVLASGLALLSMATPDLALWIKIALALVAIGANVVCFKMVIRRGKRPQPGVDGSEARVWTGYSRLYFRLLGVGFPTGLMALLLGLQRAGRI